jgi:hypothetical protein
MTSTLSPQLGFPDMSPERTISEMPPAVPGDLPDDSGDPIVSKPPKTKPSGRPPGPQRKRDGSGWHARLGGQQVSAPPSVVTEQDAWRWYRRERDKIEPGWSKKFDEAKGKKQKAFKRTSVNLPPQTVEALSRVTVALQREMPGVPIDQSAAIRHAIHEADDRRKKKSEKS